MNALIAAAFGRTRAVLLLLGFFAVAGTGAWHDLPKEAEPDVAIPIIYVSMSHEGISPEDAERLLVRPMERELERIEGVKEMTSRAEEGHASVQLEFTAGFDARRALDDVRERVDVARTELPEATEEPEVHEVNVALFPVLTVALSGPVPEATLRRLANRLEDRLEALRGVLEVDIGGDREDLLEVVVEPTVMETYGVTYGDLLAIVRNNNLLVAAGALDTGAGRLALEVPGVVETAADLLEMPMRVGPGHVVRLGDVAELRRTTKDPQGWARIDGRPAVTLEVKKRIGANIIDTIAEVRRVVETERAGWPATVQVDYLQDKSDDIREMLRDLENNVVSAVLLVMLVVLAALGPRPALLVGLAIPSGFLMTLLALHLLDYTLNIVVLFSLILMVGQLVDSTTIVVEHAERLRAAGVPTGRAYLRAAQRMAWPMSSSTLCTLVVFLPLLFWPGVVGQFMKYLPITAIVTLIASVLVALVFVPVLGAITPAGAAGAGGETPTEEGPVARAYARLLAPLLDRPLVCLAAATCVLAAASATYAMHGRGVEFFPDVEPEFAQVQVHARGDLSVHEKDALVQAVEARILGMPEIDAVYARSMNTPEGDGVAEDVVGVIQLEFVSWQRRRPAAAILDDIRVRTADIPGVVIELREAESGPGGGKPVEIEIAAADQATMHAEVERLRALMQGIGDFVDVEDDRPLPGIDWRLDVDRAEAARLGADVASLGSAVQLLTQGIKLSDYRPDDSDDEVDIRVRYPVDARHLMRLGDLRVPTAQGMVPLDSFVELVPGPKTGTIKRVDGARVVTLRADVARGRLVDDAVDALRAAIAAEPPPAGVELRFEGEDADQAEAADFLGAAFGTAIFLMALVLVLEFNDLWQTLIVLSAVVFSIAGVLIGLLVTDQPFGIVMSGLGLIALAGIVVNNNIVLIDAYREARDAGLPVREAALRAASSRLRPVFLTALTTVLGLVPMVLAMNVDFIARSVSFGAPSTQWWTQLASTIAGGLSFATLLTLVLTPCLLVVGERWFTPRATASPTPAATPEKEPLPA